MPALPSLDESIPLVPLHIPVMRSEILNYLQPKQGERFVDATFGQGGYTTTLLDEAPCDVLAVDQDIEAVQLGQVLSQKYPDRLIIAHGNFRDLPTILASHDIHAVDGFVFDLGVSATQINQPHRGFSFYESGPLDMRMDRTQSLTAAEVVNTYSLEALIEILRKYGEERQARAIAREIIRRRQIKAFQTTDDLADLVSKIAYKPMRHPATRTFQALRIYVNQELEALESILPRLIPYLREGGRLVIVSFHSLEDRIVKQFMQSFKNHPEFEVKKKCFPTTIEQKQNPRSRSAILRCLVKKTEPFPPGGLPESHQKKRSPQGANR